jgi:hypothetical protein
MTLPPRLTNTPLMLALLPILRILPEQTVKNIPTTLDMLILYHSPTRRRPASQRSPLTGIDSGKHTPLFPTARKRAAAQC